MKHLKVTLMAIAVAAIAAVSPALAHGFKVGDIDIGHPYARAMLPGAKVGAVISHSPTTVLSMIDWSAPRQTVPDPSSCTR